MLITGGVIPFMDFSHFPPNEDRLAEFRRPRENVQNRTLSLPNPSALSTFYPPTELAYFPPNEGVHGSAPATSRKKIKRNTRKRPKKPSKKSKKTKRLNKRSRRPPKLNKHRHEEDSTSTTSDSSSTSSSSPGSSSSLSSSSSSSSSSPSSSSDGRGRKRHSKRSKKVTKKNYFTSHCMFMLGCVVFIR